LKAALKLSKRSAMVVLEMSSSLVSEPLDPVLRDVALWLVFRF
jgi:meiosis induction protein kinase IME2/SME1